jgi:hypothetical protein
MLPTRKHAPPTRNHPPTRSQHPTRKQLPTRKTPQRENSLHRPFIAPRRAFITPSSPLHCTKRLIRADLHRFFIASSSLLHRTPSSLLHRPFIAQNKPTPSVPAKFWRAPFLYVPAKKNGVHSCVSCPPKNGVHLYSVRLCLPAKKIGVHFFPLHHNTRNNIFPDNVTAPVSSVVV